MPGSKHWCFTLNNHGESDEERLAGLQSNQQAGVVYLVFGREVGASGTPHLQGFISFAKRRTLNVVKRFVGERAHCESAKGSPSQAATYCKKEGDYEEFGQCPGGQGTRSDLAAAVEAVKAGATKRQLIEQHPGAYARAHKMLNEARLVFSEERSWETTVKVYWGDTGTGKTKKAFEDAGDVKPYVHGGEKWFDGYDGEDFVIFDDFNGSEFKLTYLLRLLDRYPMRVPVKGGYVNWKPRTIIITANYAPQLWYANAKDKHQEALMRRISEVVHFNTL